jgi:DNA-binding GntR family transcriptional regulator
LIERSGPKLIYRQIVDWMNQQISSGAWPEHFRLPSEIELAAQLGVSRGTVRKAITQLINEGLLVSIHGRGTFVESAVIEQPLAEQLIAFSEALIEKHIPFTTRVLNQQLIVPPQRITSLLATPPDEQVLLLERVRLVRQTPIVYLINYIRANRCPGVENTNFEKYRLFETLEDHYHLALGWGQRTFEAQSADEKIASALEITLNDPIMHMEQLIYLRDGNPIEFSTIWFRGPSFRLSAIVKRGEKHERTENTIIYQTPGN